jgi:hypothetical protein
MEILYGVAQTSVLDPMNAASRPPGWTATHSMLALSCYLGAQTRVP